MPTPSKGKGTARPARRSITDRLRDIATRPGADTPDVPLTDLLAGRTSHAGDDVAAAIAGGRLAPMSFRFPEPVVRAADVVQYPAGAVLSPVEQTRLGMRVVVDERVPANTVVIVDGPPAPARPAPRPVGLAQIVAELLEQCATDDGVDALKRTPGIAGSAVMNPVARAISRAVNGQCWIGDEHRYAVVQRGDTLARVELPGRLQALLDMIEQRPALYPDVTYPGRRR